MSSREKESFTEEPLGRVAMTRKIKAFMAQHPERELSSDQIKTVLAMFKQWRALGRRYTITDFSHRFFFYIAKGMFLSNFQDSETVIELLDIIMDCNYGNSIYAYFQSFLGIFVERDELHLVYFMNHVYQEKHLFNGYRMPCFLVYDFLPWRYLYAFEQAAEIRKNTLFLHQLLRYGALLSYGKNYTNPTTTGVGYFSEVFSVLSSYFELIVQINPELLPIETLTLGPEEYDNYSNLVSVCSLLLKDAPQWPLDSLNSMSFPLRCPWKENYSAFIHVFSHNVVSSFQKHFNTPMDLKEICRRVIRINLNENWQLPHGISQLPIPKSLQLYLDL